MIVSKTSLILSIWYLFSYCGKVFYKEITGLMPVNRQTIFRNICLMERAVLPSLL